MSITHAWTASTAPLGCSTARAGNRRLGSPLSAHTKALCKTDLLWETRRVLERPGRARTGIAMNPAPAAVAITTAVRLASLHAWTQVTNEFGLITTSAMSPSKKIGPPPRAATAMLDDIAYE